MQITTIKQEKNQYNTKQNKNKISLSIYSLSLFLFLTVFNRYKYGVGLSGVIIPILLFLLFNIIEKRKYFFDITISIHAPAKGATLKEIAPGRYNDISIHAPAKGATPIKKLLLTFK